MNNDNKIVKILEQQGKALEQQRKVLEAIQADLAHVKVVQQTQGEQLQSQGKDILIFKAATAQSLTIAGAVKAGVEDLQRDVKTIKAVQEEHGQKLTILIHSVTKQAKAQDTLKKRVENLEQHTNAPKIHQN